MPLLCSAYGVAKVMRLEISFRTIIHHAAACLPGVTPALFQAVPLPPGVAASMSPGRVGPGGKADIRCARGKGGGCLVEGHLIHLPRGCCPRCNNLP